jgi:ribosomal protein L40E
MMSLCHNCRNAVPEGAAFCPECGAPQLRVQSPEAREAEAEPGEAAPRHTGEIAWPAAVQSAAIYAVPAGLLLSFLAVPLIDMLWVMLGSVWTLRRYRRRVPRAPKLTPQLGGRIGLVLGLFAAVVSTATDALTFLFERYGLHHASAIDARLGSGVQAGIDRIHATNPQAAAQLPGLFQFWLSAEGRGTLLLLSAAASAMSMLFFAWLGGRFAVRYGGLRRRKQ